MRTTIEIDEDLINRAMAATGLRTKKEPVDKGLRLLVQHRFPIGIVAH